MDTGALSRLHRKMIPSSKQHTAVDDRAGAEKTGDGHPMDAFASCDSADLPGEVALRPTIPFAS